MKHCAENIRAAAMREALHYGKDYKPGDRIELHPRCDLWMRGARFATVLYQARKYVHARSDNGMRLRIAPVNITGKVQS